MKRRSVTFCILLIFLCWNAMTYFFLANRPQPRAEESVAENMVRRLGELEGQLRQQVAMHESLLRELEVARESLQQGIAMARLEPQNNADRKGDVGLVRPPAEDLDMDMLNSVTIPVLVIACNRVTIKRNLDQLLKSRPSAERFPIIVSQDCNDKPTADAILSYGQQVTLIQHPDQSDITLPWQQRKFKGYYKIARHYKWALQQIFHKFKHEAVIIVEDDLDLAPDFFEYFAATYPILRTDPSLWCVSAWNDNGKASMVSNDPELLYRTDFFPGLGWMMTRDTFLQIEDKWPKTFWDDWMRHPDQRKDKACIRPEISRTSTFGKIGVSKGQFFEKHLKFIKLNDKFVPFTKRDLTYLKKEHYDDKFVQQVYSTPLMTLSQVLTESRPELPAVRLQYSDKQGFKVQAKQLGIMDDLKSGVPRAGYRGVVSFMFRGRRVYFAPPADWTGYDISWN
eukprot:GHVT01072117.1.p1 GENE.GHVT01072117.1~~GHVT01072117.1.p1  ORF type:complete len:453 (-),score=31.11 GHVT01072117.1:524-1882(-)